MWETEEDGALRLSVPSDSSAGEEGLAGGRPWALMASGSPRRPTLKEAGFRLQDGTGLLSRRAQR